MSEKTKKTLSEYALVTLGTLLMVFGIYFFKFPNNFTTGGVTGIALIIGRFFGALSPGTLVFVINMALLVVGFLFLGRSFGIKTVYSSVLFSVGTWVLERVCPMEKPFTDEPLLELMFAVLLPAVGSGLLFNLGASSGGTDIVAMLLKKFTSINIGTALMFSDAVITVSALWFFGVKTGLFSILGLLMKSFLIDSVIESINQIKYFNIVCEHPEPICDYIVKTLHRGATVCEAEGYYTSERRYIVFAAMRRSQAVQLRRFVKQNDPHAFLLITTTSEIIGKGFRGVD
ncbi:YitT family protein [Feifania hominis]|uniref:YitT family protein n=1 Tax=Feifania hominis TaxID=2763660 RepID=A0A926DFW2_9FIRM|nr:YitT family protein [Feifania hominis]MBC8537067.1 YitT family protein [Feifania hominis]